MDSKFDDLTAAQRKKLLQLAAAAGLKREARPAQLLSRVDRREPIPQSYAQQRLWFVAQADGASAAYHIPVGWRLAGSLDKGALRSALGQLLMRHEALRTRFVQLDGEPLQVVTTEVANGFALREYDLRDHVDAEAEAARRLKQELGIPFDLEHGPLVRGALIRLADHEHVLLITFHHIVSDGWSIGVLAQELGALYQAGHRGEVAALPPLEFQYADYAAWQRRWLSEGIMERQTAFWREALADAPVALNLPSDRPRPAVQDYSGTAVRCSLDAELTAAIKALGRRHGTTLFMTLLASWAILLSRLSGEQDLVIGTPTANRGRREIEGIVGFFVNTLALRLDLAGEPSVADFLAQVKSRAQAVQAHQDIPFERVVELVRPTRSQAHSPVFQVMFAWQEGAQSTLILPEIAVSPLDLPSTTSKYDLLLSLAEEDGRIAGSLEYATALFDRDTILRFLEHWRVLVQAMVADDTQRIDRLPLLTEEQRTRLLVEWNDTTKPYPADRRVHELFEVQAEQRPTAVAVVDGAVQLTYSELNARANRLARHLQALGVAPGDVVAVKSERSAAMVVALLAILKAGGIYLPLDPADPAERTAFIINDGRPAAILSDGGGPLDERYADGIPVVALSAADPAWAGLDGGNLGRVPAQPADSPIYVMYTSGSTGRPKAVQVRERGVVNLVVNGGFADFSRGERFAFASNPAFDAATMEIWAPLLNGGSLVVVPTACLLEPMRLAELLEREAVTALFLTAALFSRYATVIAEVLGRLRFLITGGDRADPAAFTRVLEAGPPAHLINGYGPTETTTFAIAYEAQEIRPWPTVPLGRPLANMRIYILDRHGEPVPIGVTGEIHIAGAGVAIGYVNLPALTAERFVADPFADAQDDRMYKTGDLGRWLPDGTVEFVGRRDFQVKLRGFRVELGEIEACLSEHPAVREAVVCVYDGLAERRLVAYYVPGADVASGVEVLTEHLRRRLPDYMVPAAYVRLTALPLTANGKIDRQALPAPDDSAYKAGIYEAPHGRIETILARIWAQLLKRETIGRNDNFFELGGHSLLAVQVASRLRKQLGIEVAVGAIFANPILADFARSLDHAEAAVLPPITAVDRNGAQPLSFAQRRLWFLTHMKGVSAAYHIPMGWRLEGSLDEVALRRALDELVARHEALRTTFLHEDAEPAQRVGMAEASFALGRHDLSSGTDAREALARLLDEEVGAPFDIEHGPLVRGRLIKLTADVNVLLLTMHHIIADGWSMTILQKELSELYAAYLGGRPSPLAPLAFQYVDYAAWQRRWIEGEVLARQAEYWRQALAGAPAILELPTDRPRPAQQDYAGDRVFCRLDQTLTRGVKELGQRHGTTLFMTLLAAWAALLSRLSGQQDLVIGTPSANRGRGDVEGIVGFFVNTLALRVDLSGMPTVGELLAKVKLCAIAAQEHQDIPFEQVVELVRPVRSLSHSPLFQVMFVWQDPEQGALALPGIRLASVEMPHTTAKYDLLLSVSEENGCIAGELEYATALFDADTVERLLGHWRTLLHAMVTDDTQSVEQLPLLTAEERRLVLAQGDAVASREQSIRCVHEMFEAQAALRPEATAIVFERNRLTYGELNARANQLAHHLRGLGVGPEIRVAICLERSFDLVVGFLAILKAGGIYVPLDPSYPAERLTFMLDDSAPAAVLVHHATRHVLQGAIGHTTSGLLVLDFEDASRWSACTTRDPISAQSTSMRSRAAYLIYTSGSTGRPKGVVNHHLGLSNLTTSQIALFEVEPGSQVLQFGAIGFDVSIADMTMALCSGACLHLASREALQPGEPLRNILRSREISHVSLPPAVLSVLADADELEGVETLILGGDIPPSGLVQSLSSRMRVFNVYGPTEAAVCATAHRCRSGESLSVPIGRPLAGVRIYILDRSGQPTPINVPGEIHIGGVGVGRGYWNRQALTDECFVPDPFCEEPGARMYKTGDLGRWLPSGTIEFLGRRDSQVKLRGFRIELGEIEARLLEHPGIREVAVALRTEDGQPLLVAYFVPSAEQAAAAGAPSIEVLTAWLSTYLPDYMVPSAFVELTMLPLTSNGKLDRQALPAPNENSFVARPYLPPQGKYEIALAQIWSELLKRKTIGRHDNFFELGGHSLLAVQVTSRLRKRLGVDAAVGEIFARPVLADLASALADFEGAALPRLVPADRREPVPLSFAQQRVWFLTQMKGVSEAYHIPMGWRLHGDLDRGALCMALDRLVARHEAWRTRFVHETTEPQQCIDPAEACAFALQSSDLSLADDRESALAQLLEGEIAAPFDLAAGPLVRGRLIRLAARDHVLLISMHHIVSDGWSIGIVARDLASLYRAYCRGEPDPLAPLPIQYADYAVWQRRWLEGQVLGGQGAYWQQALAGAPALIELPTDRARPAQQNYAGDLVRCEFDAALTRDLKRLSQRHGTTLFMTLMAGWAILLSRLSGQQDLVIGTPSANRGRGDIEGIVGFFVNTLALRIDLSGGPTVADVLGRVRAQAISAQGNQDIPFEQVVELTRPIRSLSYSPLFQAMFAWQDNEQEQLSLAGLEVMSLEMPHGTAKYDLLLSLWEDGGRVVGGLEYATALFDRATVERYLEHLRLLLAAMAANPAQHIERLHFLTPMEARLIHEVNDTKCDLLGETARPALLHHPLLRQLRRSAEQVAVVSADCHLTYGQLDVASARLATLLRANGARADRLVAIVMEKGWEQVVAALGILRAGSPFLPIDANLGDARIRQLLELGEVGQVVSTPALADRLRFSSQLELHLVDRDLFDGAAPIFDEPVRSEADLAYVIFTSGSTGIPKGVMIDHRGALNTVLDINERFAVTAHDTVLGLSSLSFDLSIYDIFGVLGAGGRLILPLAAEARDPRAWERYARQEGVTIWNSVPALMQMLAESEPAAELPLRLVLMSGDWIPLSLPDRIRSFARQAEIISLGGATEASIWSIYFPVGNIEPNWNSIPYGRALANQTFRVLLPDLTSAPIGVAGELFIGGIGLALGYWRDERATAKSFFLDPATGERLYRTGDLGRLKPDGLIEFLGREDGQIKINGFRIELGEIEAHLAAHPAIKSAVVLVREDSPGNRRLVAYYTQGESLTGVESLRNHLEARLPNYMVPTAYVRIDSLPLTANGKLDRAALPVPAIVSVGEYEAPQGRVEASLARIWADLLNVPRVGRHDNFFELGGHSLMMITLMKRMQAEGMEADVSTLFAHPTLASLASSIEEMMEICL